jgi:hypothetical protein
MKLQVSLFQQSRIKSIYNMIHCKESIDAYILFLPRTEKKKESKRHDIAWKKKIKSPHQTQHQKKKKKKKKTQQNTHQQPNPITKQMGEREGE